MGRSDWKIDSQNLSVKGLLEKNLFNLKKMLISASGDVEKLDNMEPKELNKIEYLKENQISTMKEKNTNLVVNHFLQSEKSCCNNELKKHITIACKFFQKMKGS